MKNRFLLKSLILLFVLIVGLENVWADPTTISSLVNNTTTGWYLSTGGTSGSGTSLYHKLTTNSHYIQSPTITWSDYTSITIKIKARTYGGVDAAKNKISVSEGSTELTSYTPSGTSLIYSDELSISPSSGALTIACKGADGSKGSGISEIIIAGVLASTGEETTVIIDASSVVNNLYGSNTDGGTFSATVYDSSDDEIDAATVTWSSSDATVATISSTGALTLKKVGFTTITATYAGITDVYQSSYNTYDLEVVNEDPTLVTIWSENFSGYSANDVPSGGTYSYSCVNNNTKIYSANLAGGTSPELLVAKTTGTFTAIVPLLTSYGYSGDLTLKYKTNAKSLTVATTTDDITINDLINTSVTYNSAGTHTITFKGVTTSTESITIVFSAGGDNVRLDDIVLKGYIAVPVNGSNEITTDVTIPAGATYVISSELKIPSNTTLTVNGTLINETAANLVIEDGGQLIASNSVAAQVKKNITAAAKEDEVYGWYAISSPVHTGGNAYVTPVNVNNLILNSDEYDLFYYNESDHEWKNYKLGGGFNLNAGQGYIYRNSTGADLTFEGNTNYGEVTYTLSYTTLTGTYTSLSGFNLIGNPYPHNISKGEGELINSIYLATGFYTLANSGKWTTHEDGDAILPQQGVLVEATLTANGKTLTINDAAAKGSRNVKANNDNIKFTVANSQYDDNAYAWFDKVAGLKKIEHRNADIPMLYINQDGTNYAIATMGDETKSFNLCFKAMTMGKYTLSYEANGEFTYLHIIDRLTGEDVDMLMEGEYSFIASPTDNDNRFIVKLSYQPGYNAENDEIFAYQNGNEIVVNGDGELQVFDVTGRIVMNTIVNGVEPVNAPANGVYIFRLIGNEVKTQKIVVR